MIDLIFYLMCLMVSITAATLWVLFQDNGHQNTTPTKNHSERVTANIS